MVMLSALIMALFPCVLPAPAYALPPNAVTSGDYVYTVLDEGTKTAQLYFVANASGDVQIPSSIDGYKIIKLGYLNSYSIFSYFSNNTVISVTIPNGVTTIGENAFYQCKALTSVTIPDSVTNIESHAFSCCDNLQNITIPTGVTTIGNFAFSLCPKLTVVNIPSNVTSLGLQVFAPNAGLTDINVSPENPNYKSIDGVLFNKNGTTLIQYPCGKPNTTYQIPNSVTSIGWRAFYYCNNLVKVDIPGSVSSVGYMAFYGCTKLTGAYFYGNAPTVFDYHVFANDVLTYPLTFKIYYINGKTGWTNPWKGYPTATFVSAITLQTIAITNPASKLSYNIGDPLDITGLTVTGYYNNGSTAILPLTNANITGFNSSFPIASQTLTVTVEGKTTTYNITIAAPLDVTAPILTTPPDLTVEATGEQTTVDIGKATATDASAVTITNDAPATFPLGTTTVTWTAIDDAGNKSTGIQKVSVQDTTKPIITINDVKAEATGVRTTVNIGQATATDIFAVTVTSDAPADYPLGTTSVNWTATDANGNANTAVQKVTVLDTTMPVICIPADITIKATSLQNTVNIGMATASDFFPVAITNNAPAQYPVGTTVVTWTAADTNGNISTGNQKITFYDEKPIITITGDKTIEEGLLLCLVISASDPDDSVITLSATQVPQGATFNPSNGSLTWTPDFSQAGTYQIMFAASDGVLTTSETLTITVVNVSVNDIANNLLNYIGTINAGNGLGNTLNSKLSASLKSLEKGNMNASVNQLRALVNEVEAQRGKALSIEQADKIISEAKRLIAVILAV